MPRHCDYQEVRQREHDGLDTAMTGGSEDVTCSRSPNIEDGFQRSTRGEKKSTIACWGEDEEIYRGRHMSENVQTS